MLGVLIYLIGAGIGLFVLYYIIKLAVKNAIIEAHSISEKK